MKPVLFWLLVFALAILLGLVTHPKPGTSASILCLVLLLAVGGLLGTLCRRRQ